MNARALSSTCAFVAALAVGARAESVGAPTPALCNRFHVVGVWDGARLFKVPGIVTALELYAGDELNPLLVDKRPHAENDAWPPIVTSGSEEVA